MASRLLVVTTSPPTIGWGILSTGGIATTFAQDLRLLSDQARLVAVGSRTLASAQTFASEHGFARAYGSYAEVAADEDVDIIYIGSPHQDHFPSAMMCLEAGKPLLVEKPLTVTEAEAVELFALARQQGLFVMEAMWTRTNPLVRKAVELVDSGELGGVRHVSGSFGLFFDGPDTHRLLAPELAGGAILDLGVYPVHAAQLFLGEPDQVMGYGSLRSTGVDGHAAATLTYPATADRPACTAHVMCSLDIPLPQKLMVLCTGGTITVDHFLSPTEMKVTRGTDWEAEPEVMVTDLYGRGYTYEAVEVMRCLEAGLTESPLVPWQDTLATMRTLNAWQAAVAAAAGPAGTTTT